MRKDFHFPLERSLQTYILSVFLVYAREAIELGKTGIWTVDQVRAQALEGLRLIAIHGGSQKNRNFIEQHGLNIKRETQQEFELTREWEEFEDELLALADSVRNGRPGPSGIPASTVVRPESSCRDKPKLNLGLISKFVEEEGYKNDDLAADLRISSRAVSSLRNDGEYHDYFWAGFFCKPAVGNFPGCIRHYLLRGGCLLRFCKY